ncbi:MAG: hypothetical protein ACXQS8_09875 [Candidatus Helarchaeales archaeon]
MSQGDSMILNMLTGLLEDAVKALQRIERKVEDQTIVFNDILQKMEVIEKKFESEFAILSQRSLPELQQALTEEIESLGLQDLNDIEISLDHILNKLQKSIQILTIQGLVRRIESLSSAPIPQAVSVAPAKKGEPSRAAISSAPASEQTPAPTMQAQVSPASTVPATPTQPAEEEDDEEHNLRPSSFFGS